MDLGLDDPHGAAELLGGFNGLLDGEGRDATGYRHAELGKNFLALVLVTLHEETSLGRRLDRSGIGRCPRATAQMRRGGGQSRTVSWCGAPTEGLRLRKS